MMGNSGTGNEDSNGKLLASAHSYFWIVVIAQLCSLDASRRRFCLGDEGVDPRVCSA